MEASLVWDELALLGEGPLWDAREQCLHWVDVDGCTLHTLSPGTDERPSTRYDARISSVGLREGSGLVVAHDRGFSLLEDGIGVGCSNGSTGASTPRPCTTSTASRTGSTHLPRDGRHLRAPACGRDLARGRPTGLSDDMLAREPHAGSLFSLTPGVHGRPAFRFAG